MRYTDVWNDAEKIGCGGGQSLHYLRTKYGNSLVKLLNNYYNKDLCTKVTPFSRILQKLELDFLLTN